MRASHTILVPAATSSLRQDEAGGQPHRRQHQPEAAEHRVRGARAHPAARAADREGTPEGNVLPLLNYS